MIVSVLSAKRIILLAIKTDFCSRKTLLKLLLKRLNLLTKVNMVVLSICSAGALENFSTALSYSPLSPVSFRNVIGIPA